MHCFGAGQVELRVHAQRRRPIPEATPWSGRAATLLTHTDAGDSYCIVAGMGSGGLISELLRQSELRLIVVDPDQHYVDKLRRHYDHADLYGTRIFAHVGRPAAFGLPPYMASVFVAEESLCIGLV